MTRGDLCALDSRSDDHITIHGHVLSRVVSRLIRNSVLVNNQNAYSMDLLGTSPTTDPGGLTDFQEEGPNPGQRESPRIRPFPV